MLCFASKLFRIARMKSGNCANKSEAAPGSHRRHSLSAGKINESHSGVDCARSSSK